MAALPGFTGTLGELAAALRAGRVSPAEVPLLALTREVLAWAGQVTGAGPTGLADAHPDLLPTLAAVIALKARLLLPPPRTTTCPRTPRLTRPRRTRSCRAWKPWRNWTPWWVFWLPGAANARA
ncbi:hypothetical protein [Deinococcus multiflagellatus]|uniref:Uncharacterized protein n=1 Tax=Deinococcus multiflagellatus TaxID=1656887 RepID=A0ABW1ZJW5_9DEIO